MNIFYHRFCQVETIGRKWQLNAFAYQSWKTNRYKTNTQQTIREEGSQESFTIVAAKLNAVSRNMVGNVRYLGEIESFSA